ncbi:MAG: MFS transporter [Simkaniaceae bacterium]|nr:MAG: MFS transporter [Simkaniaceae bacterium]
MTERKINRPNFYLFYILLFIYGDIACENYIFRTYSSLIPSTEFVLFIGMLLLQVIAAPIQAAFSDLYCRKKSLVISLSASLIAMFFLLLFNLKILFFVPLIFCLSFVKGAFGNTIPLSLAAIADTQDKNYRFSFGLSTLAYTLAYLMMIFAVLFLKEKTAIAIILGFYVIIVFIAIKFFKDIRDKDIHVSTHSSVYALVKREIGLVFGDLKKSFFQNAITAFLLWEISVYCVLLLYVDFNKVDFRLISVTMMLGYGLGILILKFFGEISDKMMSRIGFLLGSVSLIPFYFHFAFHENPNFSLLAGCYFFHSVGMAILPPTLFAMLAKGAKQHEQGRLYGIIESVDTIAFLFSSIAVMIFDFAKLHLAYIISLSFLTIALSWVPFKIYEKTRPKELTS